ncbi:MAG: hypothetical protein ACRYG4_16615 [Janthinobacterium lividum]
MIRRAIAAGLLAASLTGCVAEAAYDVVTLPVRVVGKGIDAVVPSQRAADRKRGRRDRKAEEQAAEARKKAAKAQEKAARAQERTRREAARLPPAAG